MESKIDKTFKRELLKSLGYEEEGGGYLNIKYYSKNNTVFILNDKTDRIIISNGKGTHERYISNSNFLKILQDEL